MNRQLLAAVFLVNLVSSLPRAQSSQNLADLVEDVRPSVFTIATYDNSGERRGTGTGFIVGRNQILTNYHVVSDAHRIELRNAEGVLYGDAELQLFDRNADLALLRSQSIDPSIRPLRLTSSRPRAGEKILVVGNPLGLSSTATDGIVSAFRSVERMGTLIQITAPISPGSSGSPVLNMNGQVVGMATLYIKAGQNLNFAIPSETLISFAPLTDARTPSRPNPETGGTGRWRRLDTDMAYDTETITRKSGLVLVWIKYDDSDSTYSKVLTEFDCNSSRIRRLRSLYYSTPSANPEESGRNENWLPLVPDTKGEAAFDVFCKNKRDYQSLLDYDRYRVLYVEGAKLQLQGEFEGANETYVKIITELPDYAAWGFRALARNKLAQGNIRAARNAAYEAMKIEPLKAESFSTLGDVYKAENNWPAAIQAYLKALKFGDEEFNRSSRYRVIADLQGIYERQKNYVALTNLLKAAIQRGESGLYDDLAKVYDKREIRAQARITRLAGIKYYQKRIKSGSTSALDYWELADLFEGINDNNGVESTLIAGIELFPDSVFLVKRLAANFDRDREWKKSVQLIRETLPRMKKSDDKIDLLRTLKSIYAATGNTVEAARVDRQISDLQRADTMKLLQ